MNSHGINCNGYYVDPVNAQAPPPLGAPDQGAAIASATGICFLGGTPPSYADGSQVVLAIWATTHDRDQYVQVNKEANPGCTNSQGPKNLVLGPNWTIFIDGASNDPQVRQIAAALKVAPTSLC